MKILAVESSFDETAAAIVEDGKTLISNTIASSADMHVKYGGVIPEIAARQQIKSIIPTIEHCLEKASMDTSEIDSLAVTYGPGLIGSLLVGVETVKTLSLVYKKPLIRVNHLVGHIYGAWVDKEHSPEFPLLAMIVSGGHSDLVYMQDHGRIKWIGGTRDDAAGEAFDKTARLLGLGFPGGPAISKAAERCLMQNLKLDLFPRPMISSGDYDLSFSGLKTAVYNYTKNKAKLDTDILAAQIQEAIVDVLVSKSLNAISEYKVSNFVLSGGVAANNRLKEKFAEKLPEHVSFFVPEPKHCTDNAVMIAAAAFYNQNYIDPIQLNANPQLTIDE